MGRSTLTLGPPNLLIVSHELKATLGTGAAGLAEGEGGGGGATDSAFMATALHLSTSPASLKTHSPSELTLTNRTGYWAGARGGAGGSPKGLVHNPHMQFFTLGSSKTKVFETHFCFIP